MLTRSSSNYTILLSNGDFHWFWLSYISFFACDSLLFGIQKLMKIDLSICSWNQRIFCSNLEEQLALSWSQWIDKYGPLVLISTPQRNARNRTFAATRPASSSQLCPFDCTSFTYLYLSQARWTRGITALSSKPYVIYYQQEPQNAQSSQIEHSSGIDGMNLSLLRRWLTVGRLGRIWKSSKQEAYQQLLILVLNRLFSFGVCCALKLTLGAGIVMVKLQIGSTRFPLWPPSLQKLLLTIRVVLASWPFWNSYISKWKFSKLPKSSHKYLARTRGCLRRRVIFFFSFLIFMVLMKILLQSRLLTIFLSPIHLQFLVLSTRSKSTANPPPSLTESRLTSPRTRRRPVSCLHSSS